MKKNIRATALQFVRKIRSYHRRSKVNQAESERTTDKVTIATTKLLPEISAQYGHPKLGCKLL